MFQVRERIHYNQNQGAGGAGGDQGVCTVGCESCNEVILWMFVLMMKHVSVQRLRTENRLLKQRIDTLEKVSASASQVVCPQLVSLTVDVVTLSVAARLLRRLCQAALGCPVSPAGPLPLPVAPHIACGSSHCLWHPPPQPVAPPTACGERSPEIH